MRLRIMAHLKQTIQINQSIPTIKPKSLLSALRGMRAYAADFKRKSTVSGKKSEVEGDEEETTVAKTCKQG